MPLENAPAKLKFVFRKPDNYEMHYANGVYGGFNAQGDLLCNFFFEYTEQPKELTGEVVGNELKMDPPKRGDIIRELKCGIILTPIQANAIKVWLEEKLKEFDEKFKIKEEVCTS
jgi:hypothetical protein